MHTLNPARPRAEAFGVRGGEIIAVGSAAELANLSGPGTAVVDLDGAVVLPGLMDVHNHHAAAGEADLHRLQFPPTASVEEILASVRDRVRARPDEAWVVGGTWGSTLLDRLADPASLDALDKASFGRPVLLTDDSHHNRWANTAAMRLAGVLGLAGDPAGGHIVRGQDGAPTGLLFEAAGAMVEKARVDSLDPDVEWHARNSERAVEILHSFGVTAFQDAGVSLELLAALQRLDEQGRLNAWVVSSMLINDIILGMDVVGEELLAQGERFRTRHHRPDFAKIFLDGVPTTLTGAFLDPYLPDETHGACHRGQTTMSVGELAGWLRRAGELGVGLKVHCTGDASARMVLDVVAEARAEGLQVPTVQIAHGQFLHPDDVPRFGELGVVNDMSPALWFPGVIVDALRAVLPEPRASRMQPVRSLLDSGALVAGGSDWPVAPSPDPWTGIAGLVTRRDPTGQFAGELWPEQAIGVTEAIAAYTTGAARAMGLSGVTGSLTPGLSADFVVLDRDPFAVPTEELGATTTLQTWFAGRRVFTRG
ncbi:amidohydrolase [Pseudonocardia humida]|uniref:amidohydrolase n=1 Tax=Pseudonocardia humida TaxID=2800819 RepID=UPI00207D38B5|nr:amidohydrolase [Pseudonocardia humida]